MEMEWKVLSNVILISDLPQICLYLSHSPVWACESVCVNWGHTPYTRDITIF